MMPPFNIDDILSDFESKSKATPKGGLDIDSILSDFNVSESKALPKDIKKVIATGESNPPRPEDFANSKFEDVPKTRRSLPTTNIGESITDAFNSGRETFSQGLNDISSGKPATGVGKAALGALGTLISPATGLVEGGVVTPVTDITGSKRIGEAVGAVAGLGLPVGRATKAVVASIPKNKALSTLVENIGRENLPEVVAAMKANPRLGPADLSPRVLQDTQHLFANEGPQIDYLAKTSGNRMASSKSTINDAYDTSGGVSVDLAQKMTDLATASKKVGNEKIQPALIAAGPVNVTSTIEAIDKVLKPGVTSVISGESSLPLTAVKKELAQIKAMLGNDKEMRTSAADLHKFQSGLRTTAESLMKSSVAADKEMGKSLMAVRNNLVSDIDAAAGGKYKPALSSYRDEMHIADAFKEGYDGLFSSSKAMENSPSFIKKWFDDLTDGEKQAAREGARASIATEIGIAKNPALAGEKLARSDFNQDKLKILFGEEEAAKLIKTLQEERMIANTHNKIVEGSQTAMRTASKSQFALPTTTQVAQGMLPPAILEGASMMASGTPGIATAALATAKTGFAIKDAIKMKLAREHNARYAQYALPTEGPNRDALIAALEAQIPGPKPSLVTRGANTLSRIVAP